MSTEKKLDFKWYVLRTISGKEKKIKDYILQEVAGVGAAEKVPQVVIPVEKRLQIRNGKKVVVESNMMPGYMLLEGKLDPDLISIIRNVPNVIDFLGKENPTPLRESEAKRMLGIVDELTEKDYIPFLVNRSLSYHSDCIMYANEMNRRHYLDKKLQNDFLLNTIRSKKRPFAKWVKSEKSGDIECVKFK